MGCLRSARLPGTGRAPHTSIAIQVAHIQARMAGKSIRQKGQVLLETAPRAAFIVAQIHVQAGLICPRSDKVRRPAILDWGDHVDESIAIEVCVPWPRCRLGSGTSFASDALQMRFSDLGEGAAPALKPEPVIVFAARNVGADWDGDNVEQQYGECRVPLNLLLR